MSALLGDFKVGGNTYEVAYRYEPERPGRGHLDPPDEEELEILLVRFISGNELPLPTHSEEIYNAVLESCRIEGAQ